MKTHDSALSRFAGKLDPEELRNEFLVSGFFQPGEITLHWWETDRAVIGGIRPSYTFPSFRSASTETKRITFPQNARRQQRMPHASIGVPPFSDGSLLRVIAPTKRRTTSWKPTPFQDMPATETIQKSDYSLVGKDSACAIEKGLAEAALGASPGAFPKTALNSTLCAGDPRPLLSVPRKPKQASEHWNSCEMKVLAVALLIASQVLVARAATTPVFAPEDVLTDMRRVADWQLAHPVTLSIDTWEKGAFYAGIMALSDLVPDGTYARVVAQLGAQTRWTPSGDPYNADFCAISQSYLELYLQQRDPAMLVPTKKQFDHIKSTRPAPGAEKKIGDWDWCDALFMGPPAWARLFAATGNQAYLEHMNLGWWTTSEFLYDPVQHLYSRDKRFLDATKEPNGRKVFWSRGNGWVIAGLVRVLQFMPDDYPDRPRYERQFKEMAAALLAIQRADGLWPAGLLAQDIYTRKETSGSGFFIYAFAWGVNRGLLPREPYETAARHGWRALNSCVDHNSRLLHTQPVGDSPVSTDFSNRNEDFAVGAFLLAGSEIYRLALLGDAPRTTVCVTSGLSSWREHETIEVDWVQVASRVPGITSDNVVVLTERAASPLVVQVLRDGGSGAPSALLWQADFASAQALRFDVVAKAGMPAPVSAARAFARYVPERFDDIAWENDCIAYRVYGPALQATGEVSSGVDVWVKKVRYPVIEKWLSLGDYHNDHGEGLDAYKVGPTAGAGGVAIWKDGRLHFSKNYTRWRILANGPIRAEFELTYAPWNAAGIAVSEVKSISLDLGSNLSRFTSLFTSDVPTLPVAIGLVLRDGGRSVTPMLEEGWFSYWEPAHPKHGTIGVGVVLPPGLKASFIQAAGHALGVIEVRPGMPLTYYAGAGWSQSPRFSSQLEWEIYVQQFASRVRSPLQVSLSAAR